MTEETSSEYLKIPRYALDDVNQQKNKKSKRHSEGGMTEETSSKCLKITRCALDDVNQQKK